MTGKKPDPVYDMAKRGRNALLFFMEIGSGAERALFEMLHGGDLQIRFRSGAEYERFQIVSHPGIHFCELSESAG